MCYDVMCYVVLRWSGGQTRGVAGGRAAVLQQFVEQLEGEHLRPHVLPGPPAQANNGQQTTVKGRHNRQAYGSGGQGGRPWLSRWFAGSATRFCDILHSARKTIRESERSTAASGRRAGGDGRGDLRNKQKDKNKI